MKLSQKIQSKIDKQKFVGHDNAAVITYKMLEEWIDDAVQLEQNCIKHGVSGKRQEFIKFIKWVGDGYDFEKVGESIVDEYLAACASGAVDKTVSEGDDLTKLQQDIIDNATDKMPFDL